MKILYPASLWMLGGLALLIALQFFKPRAEEKTLSTPWLWRLSERFRSRRQSIRRFKKIMLFLLQLLTLATAMLLALQIRVPMAGSNRDFIAIVDISASMEHSDGEATRLQRAQAQLLRDASALPEGSAVTVIAAGASPRLTLERSRVRGEWEHAVHFLQTDFSAGNLPDALAEAQKIVWAHPEAEVRLYTDHPVEAEDVQVTVIREDSAWNAAILRFEQKDTPSKTVFGADITSFGRDAEITCALYVDGRLNGARQVFLPADTPTEIVWEARNVARFSSARLLLQAEDSLALDNEAWYLAPPARSVRVLLCSDTPFYWEQALSAFRTVELHTRAQAAWEDTFSGYDIYVFDGALPKELPQDGSLWLVNPDRLPRETGMLLGAKTLGGVLTASRDVLDERAARLAQQLPLQDVMLQTLRAVSDTERFSSVLTAGEQSALLARRENTGLTWLVLPFDLHDSNLPLTADFIILTRNLLQYAMPDMLKAQAFEAGQSIQAELLPRATEVYLTRPDGGVSSLPFTAEGVAFQAEAPGVYTLLQNRPGEDAARFVDFSVRIPPGESAVSPKAEERPLSLSRDPDMADGLTAPADADDGLLDIKYYLAGALLLLLALEWGMYHREQY